MFLNISFHSFMLIKCQWYWRFKKNRKCKLFLKLAISFETWNLKILNSKKGMCTTYMNSEQWTMSVVLTITLENKAYYYYYYIHISSFQRFLLHYFVLSIQDDNSRFSWQHDLIISWVHFKTQHKVKSTFHLDLVAKYFAKSIKLFSEAQLKFTIPPGHHLR